jgi:YHS domain-containing protein
MPKDNSNVKGIVKDGLYVDTKGKAICPVTGDEVLDGKGVGNTTYKGVKYIFCCPGCPEEFKAHPDKYAMK